MDGGNGSDTPPESWICWTGHSTKSRQKKLRTYLDDRFIEGDNVVELSHIQYPDAVYLETTRSVQSLLDSLANGNGDSNLENEEQRLMIDGLNCVAREEEVVDNYFKEAIDQEKYRRVDWREVRLILQTTPRTAFDVSCEDWRVP